MPFKSGNYATIITKTGKKVRLHFTKSGKVNEAKNLVTGATHTPKEFAADRKKKKSKKK